MSSSVEHWFKRLNPRTVKVAQSIFGSFLVWLGENGGGFSGSTPDDLIGYQVEHGGYEILDLVQDFVRVKGRRAGYKRRVYGCIRSFFMHNRAELPRDPGFRVQANKPKVVGTLTLSEFKRLLASSNPCYRAVFLCMFQGGMDAAGLLHWSNHGLESTLSQLERRINPIRVDLPGRKSTRNMKPYYTFVGGDGIQALRTWLDMRPDADSIFVTQFQQPVTYKSLYRYWLLKLQRLGLIKKKAEASTGNRYGKNPHELRDLFRTRWRPSGCDVEVAEFMMGHDIDKLGYDKSPKYYPEWYMEQYIKAEPWLNIVTEDPDRVPRSQLITERRELEDLKKQVKLLAQRIGLE